MNINELIVRYIDELLVQWWDWEDVGLFLYGWDLGSTRMLRQLYPC